MQAAHPAGTVGTLPAQGFCCFARSGSMTAMATLDRRKMPEPRSLIAALRLNAGSPSQPDVVEVLRMFAKDSVRVRLAVLSAMLLAQLSLRVFALSARLATAVAMVLCASAI